MASNNLIKSTWLENTQRQKKSADLFSRTMVEFYRRSKDDRQKLREGNVPKHEVILQDFVSNLKMARLESGQRTAKAILKKAMRHANQKAEKEKATKTRRLQKVEEKVEEKDEKKMSLSVKERRYPHSIPSKYVSYLRGEMNIIDRGISLKGLRTILMEYLENRVSFEMFLQRNKDLLDVVRCPGETLVHMLVKPETRESDSYIEMLYGIYSRSSENCETDEEVKMVETELDETLGAVNVFVSHTWLYSFEMLVESIEEWELNWEKQNGKKHETFFYFIDYLAVNQHDMAADLSKLQEVVKNSKVTCLILSPWEDPIPLRRCWCVYEIAKTELFPSTRLHVAFPPHEVKRFKKNFFSSKKVHEIARIIEKVDSSTAEASYKPDKEMIVADIKKNLGGFSVVNQLCIRNLRKWLIDKSCEFGDEEARGEFYNKNNDYVTLKKALWVLKNVGTFLRQQGEFEKSVKYLMDAKKLMEKHYCRDFDEKEGDYDEKVEVRPAKPALFLRSWSIEPDGVERSWRIIKAGVEKSIKDEIEQNKQKIFFLGLLNSLANALTDDKRFEEAETIYAKTLEWRRELLTSNHKDTKMTQFNLGVCLIHQKKFKKAEELLNETLTQWPKNVKYYYWALFNLADLKSKTGRPEEAAKDFEDACRGLRVVCEVSPRDRFLSLANVLWSKHMLRHADAKLGQEKIDAILTDALAKVNLAYDNFRVNSDLSHPDTRFAARTHRRLALKLSPELVTQEKERRAGLMREGTYDRSWTGPVTKPDEAIAKNKIRVMHWNILADKLAYPDFKKGGFGCSYEDLDWSKCRKDKILAEILKYDPDVLIMVELDHYEDIRFLLQEDYGYASVWKKKFASFYADGTGIFWRKKRLLGKKIYKKALQKDDGRTADQVLVAVEFLPQESTGEDFMPFVAAGCHLKSAKKSKGEQARLSQCKQILNILQTQFRDHPIILGADLNSEYKDSEYKALAYPYLVNNGLVSSYANVRGKEPEFTSWKFRIDDDNSLAKANQVKKVVKEFKYTIDYIFHSKDLKSMAVLEMPEEKEIDEDQSFANVDIRNVDEQVETAKRRCLLPNKRCASDHLSLVVEILLPPTDAEIVEEKFIFVE